jgi:hypothetical protein
LFRFANFAYGAASDLYATDAAGLVEMLLRSCEGVKQGDPFALFLFALSMQACFELGATVPGVTAVAVSDDLELVGKPAPVFEAYDKVVAAELDENVARESDKRFVLWVHNTPPPPSLAEECAKRGLRLEA